MDLPKRNAADDARVMRQLNDSIGSGVGSLLHGILMSPKFPYGSPPLVLFPGEVAYYYVRSNPAPAEVEQLLLSQRVDPRVRGAVFTQLSMLDRAASMTQARARMVCNLATRLEAGTRYNPPETRLLAHSLWFAQLESRRGGAEMTALLQDPTVRATLERVEPRPHYLIF